MSIFSNVKFLVIGGVSLVVISTLSYFYLTVKSQNIELENKDVQIEVAKDEVKKEVLETKWETIAQEHNKSREDKHEEIKEPIEHNDSNTTDFFFFGMFRED